MSVADRALVAREYRRLTLTVQGAPRTKKTSNRLVRAGGRSVVLPSKAWSVWAKQAAIGPLRWDYDEDGEARWRYATAWVPGVVPSWAGPCNCRALFYRDAERGDAVGYMQGLADLLEKRGVIANDSLIVSWDGSRLLVDRKAPRVELILGPV